MRWMWIDKIVELEPRRRAVAIKHVSFSEDHLHDHFPAAGGRGPMPLMPASLIIEGMAQTAGLLVGHASGFREKVVLAKVTRVELNEEAVPGDTLRYAAEVELLDAAGASTRGEVWLARPGRDARQIGRVDLMFGHLDRNAAGGEFPEGNFVFGGSLATLLRLSGVE